MTNLYGQDIRLTAAFQAAVAANGELVVSDGVQTGEQDVRLRLFTRLGSLFYDVTFGSLLHDWIREESTTANRMALEAEVAARVAADPRVEPGSVGCNVTAWDETGLTAEASWTFIGEDHPSNLVLEVNVQDETVTMVVRDVQTSD